MSDFFARILQEVATRAAQINDPELNRLMAMLSLYEITDPYSPSYDAEKTKALIYPKTAPAPTKKPKAKKGTR